MAEHSKIEWTDHTFNPWIVDYSFTKQRKTSIGQKGTMMARLDPHTEPVTAIKEKSVGQDNPNLRG